MSDPRDDQMRAAVREARDVQWATMMMRNSVVFASHGLPPWAEQIGERVKRAFMGEGGDDADLRVCLHVASPTVLVCQAWEPTVVLCQTCAASGGFPPTSAVEERTCDGCRKVGDHVHTQLACYGPLLIVAGLCCRCHKRLSGFQCEKRSRLQ